MTDNTDSGEPTMAQKIEAGVRLIIPSAEFDYDNDGQIIIYTGLTFDDDGNPVPFEA